MPETSAARTRGYNDPPLEAVRALASAPSAPQPHAPGARTKQGDMTDGLRHLLQLLTRCGGWVRQLPARMRGAEGAASGSSRRGAPVDVAEARARFWSGVREGRREAEARGAKRTP